MPGTGEVCWIRFLIVAVGITFYAFQVATEGEEPEFVQPIPNLSVEAGRDAVMKCVVNNLGNHRVAWIHVDKKMLLTIHNYVITQNSRIRVSHEDSNTWYLEIKQVQLEDSGYYMCQINTQPMKSQVGHLDVVVPPEFEDETATRNVSVRERSNVTLSCRASGNPPPRIKWKREDGLPINIGDQQVSVFEGRDLIIPYVTRLHMGAYLCIASNGVPPSISRRFVVDVTFPPMIWVPNHLVGAPLGTSVTLECQTEAHPTPSNFWLRDGRVITSSKGKYETHLFQNSYRVYMKLTIFNLNMDDYGSYQCMAKNSLGETEGSVRLHQVEAPAFSKRPKPVPLKPTPPTKPKHLTLGNLLPSEANLSDSKPPSPNNFPGKQHQYGDKRGVVSSFATRSSSNTRMLSVVSMLLCWINWIRQYRR